MATEIPILQKRRIEGELIKLFYEELVPRLGKPAAQEVVRSVVRASALAQAKGFAAREPSGTSLQTFIDIQKHWTAENALEIEELRKDSEHFNFNVTRCRYAEMYRDMGLGEIGHLLSCNRDGAFRKAMTRNWSFAARRRSCRARAIAISGIAILRKTSDAQIVRSRACIALTALPSSLSPRADFGSFSAMP